LKNAVAPAQAKFYKVTPQCFILVALASNRLDTPTLDTTWIK